MIDTYTEMISNELLEVFDFWQYYMFFGQCGEPYKHWLPRWSIICYPCD